MHVRMLAHIPQSLPVMNRDNAMPGLRCSRVFPEGQSGCGFDAAMACDQVDDAPAEIDWHDVGHNEVTLVAEFGNAVIRK